MILDKPYAERRIIIVADNTDPQPSESKSVARIGFDVALDLNRMVNPLLGPLWDRLEKAGADAFTRKAQLPAGTLVVTPQVAGYELEFPPGHPVPEHAYAGHPLVPKRYVPLATFHRFLFEEKVNELMTLLASLGATRVKVTCTRGYRTAAGASFGVSKGAEAGGGAKGISERSEQATFEERYRPEGEPKLPTNLVWYSSEASWQAVAQRRLDFRTSQFNTRLSYRDAFGIDANIKVGLDQLGVKLGGNFDDFEATEWEFEGEFA